MKKLILLSLLFSLSAQASEFETVFAQAKKSLERNDFNEAIELCTKAVELKPNDLNANFFLAYSYQTIGQLDKAIEIYQTIAAFAPGHASIHGNLAHALRHTGQVHKAIAHYEQAVTIKPENASLHYGFGETLLKTGEFERGWKQFEWRYKRGSSGKKFEEKIWDGSNLIGKKVVIRAEYGLGDTIQFIRFAKFLKEAGAYVVAQVQGALVKLISFCPYVDEVVPMNKTVQFDFQIPVMSLPYKLNIFDEKELVIEIPYLFADENLVQYWKTKLAHDGNFKIGLCWEGSSYYDSLRPAQSIKSMHLSEFQLLSELPNVTLYSLQKSSASKHTDEVSFEVRTFGDDFDESNGRFMDTAALIENLDCIVTIDTSIAHLAGAMGKPVLMLLPSVADWRWMVERDDTPWYPTMKLIRQKQYGKWDDVIETIYHELANLLEQKTEKSDTVVAEISVGELIDKITILQLKTKHITNEAKLKNIRKELDILQTTRNKHVPQSEKLDEITQELYNVNAQLWDIEDDCRDKEREKQFDDDFIQITRSVYITNDKRCALKRKINLLCGSNLIEEKSYAAY